MDDSSDGKVDSPAAAAEVKLDIAKNEVDSEPAVEYEQQQQARTDDDSNSAAAAAAADTAEKATGMSIDKKVAANASLQPMRNSVTTAAVAEASVVSAITSAAEEGDMEKEEVQGHRAVGEENVEDSVAPAKDLEEEGEVKEEETADLDPPRMLAQRRRSSAAISLRNAAERQSVIADLDGTYN
jgi:hypothetical protein